MDIVSILTWFGIVLLAGIAVYMWLIEPFNIKIKEIELTFPNLPAAFDGYKILHLSDLHITKMGLLEKRLIDIISRREVDACIITGDVTAEPRASDTFRRVCYSVKHKEPIYMVLGNSEHKPWLSTEMLVDALSFDGPKLLANSSVEVRRGDEKIAIVGVDDPYSHFDDIETAFKGVSPEDFSIFLTHCPSLTPEGIKRGANLIMAGHTHGGQVRLPLIGVIWTHMRSNKKLSDGLFLSEDLSRNLKDNITNAALVVSRGIGSSRIHIRLMCPPEVIYITLRKGM